MYGFVFLKLFNPLSANVEYTPHDVTLLVATVLPRAGKIITNGF